MKILSNLKFNKINDGELNAVEIKFYEEEKKFIDVTLIN